MLLDQGPGDRPVKEWRTTPHANSVSSSPARADNTVRSGLRCPFTRGPDQRRFPMPASPSTTIALPAPWAVEWTIAEGRELSLAFQQRPTALGRTPRTVGPRYSGSIANKPMQAICQQQVSPLVRAGRSAHTNVKWIIPPGNRGRGRPGDRKRRYALPSELFRNNRGLPTRPGHIGSADDGDVPSSPAAASRSSSITTPLRSAVGSRTAPARRSPSSVGRSCSPP